MYNRYTTGGAWWGYGYYPAYRDTCPGCGRCGHCGRGGYQYPYPVYQEYFTPNTKMPSDLTYDSLLKLVKDFKAQEVKDK
jgi:hypothetical protein